MLPNFICPGAQKAGTTTLYNILKQHPQIGMPSVKEPGFFSMDRKYERGLAWYERQFYRHTKAVEIIADMSTPYLNHAEISAKRIYESLGPDLKFVFVLRDPVKRAYSQYTMKVRDCLEDESFENALKLEESRRTEGNLKDPKGRPWEYSYVENGMYAKHIREYLKYFPIENMKFLLFEEFMNDKRKYCREVFLFLGVDPEAKINYDIWENPASEARSKFVQVHITNRLLMSESPIKHALMRFVPLKLLWKASKGVIKMNRKSSNRPAIDEETKKQLIQIYRDDIKDLETIIGRDLSDWLKGA